jgi:hypothetical protein
MSNTQTLPKLIHSSSRNLAQESKKVPRQDLINKLNFINFQDDFVRLNFKHRQFKHTLSLKGKSEPCFDGKVQIHWENPAGMPGKLQSFEFDNILLDDGLKLLRVEARVESITSDGLLLILPEECQEVRSRKARRHFCKDIKVQFLQNSTLFRGELVEFSPDFCRVRLTAEPPQSFFWIDADFSGHIILSDGEHIFYSSECTVFRQSREEKVRTYVFKLHARYSRRFQSKEFRSTRLKLTPTPEAVFIHPLTGKKVNLSIDEISGSGFSVEEEQKNSVLLPGLMLPSVEVSLANTLSFKCQGQVVNRTDVGEGEEGRFKLGIALLDMDIADHVKLESVLQKASDKNSHCSNLVDMDSLWSFFFETGFIYPQKYASLRTRKEELRKTYEKLYTQHPNIARHFIYQKDGTILGHMSTLRFYENSWLFHHHAASKKDSTTAGIMVLNQMGRFVNDSRNLYSSHMKFALAYFRPENKFPNKIFGGVARHLNDLNKSSLDDFAYLHLKNENSRRDGSLKGYDLTETQKDDLTQLAWFYENKSGGLLINAMDLEPETAFLNDLSLEYENNGFTKKKHLFSLKKDGDLVAVILLNFADLGLNLSDLTNCMHVFAVNPDRLPKEVLFETLSELMTRFGQKELPVLLFPSSYAKDESIDFEKTYSLWVLNLRHMDDYFRFLKRLFRGFQH